MCVGALHPPKEPRTSHRYSWESSPKQNGKHPTAKKPRNVQWQKLNYMIDMLSANLGHANSSQSFAAKLVLAVRTGVIPATAISATMIISLESLCANVPLLCFYTKFQNWFQNMTAAKQNQNLKSFIWVIQQLHLLQGFRQL